MSKLILSFVFLVASNVAPRVDAQTQSIKLPKPTGTHAVGTTTYEWVDRQRTYSYSSQDKDNRRIVVQIWYPSSKDPKIQTAPYSAFAEEFKHVSTNSQLLPAFASGLTSCPLILISPGRGVKCHAYSAIAESLASNGYIVAAVGMPGIGYVAFSDGRIAKPNPDFQPSGKLMSGPYEKVDEFFETPTEIGRQDLEFALTQIQKLNEGDPNGRFTGKIDLTNIGLFGHSLGGRIAGALAAGSTSNVKAYISMEGIAPRRARFEGLLSMPVAMMCSSGTLPYAKDNYQTLIDGRKETVFMIELQKFGHNSVTDLPYVSPERFNYQIEPKTGLLTSIQIINAFFDSCLRNGAPFKGKMNGIENIVVSEHTRIPTSLPTLEFVNGKWFDGSKFQSRTMYSVNGILKIHPPTEIDEVIDLENGYVAPPYGEAHTHRPTTPDRFEQSSQLFLHDGIYYFMNHGSLARFQGEFADLTSRPQTIDGQFAGALLASPQSHAVELWQRLDARGSMPGVDADTLPGDAWFVMETEASLRDQWPQFSKTKPDFVKVMVEYSEEYLTRQNDKTYFGKSGLNPRLVPQIVNLAHAAGLRVSAHIETAADFRVVVESGVDIVAHLPGYDIPMEAADRRYLIDPADAARAKKQNMTIITTTLLGVDRADGDEARLAKIQRIQKQNLRLLKQAGVTVAVGSDQFSKNSVDEVLNLAALEVFDNVTLLKKICTVTPQAIFPKRSIGVLKNDAEASFLVLSGNPLDDLKQLREIRLRFQGGRLLKIE